MIQLFLVLLSGVIFSIGLGISGMTNANKVIGFLNLSRQWDPSLAFVMVGAIGVHLILFKLILKRAQPVFDHQFYIPNNTVIDRRLLIGASLFGVGWGLGGFCPGPGLVSSVGLSPSALTFVAAMIVGMILFRFTLGRTR